MQDFELLLQEHYLYRCALVVPDLRWLVFGLVSVLVLSHEQHGLTSFVCP